MEQTIIIVSIVAFIALWLLVRRVTHRKADAAKIAEKEKYAVWDAAYLKALQEGKTEYYAMMEAIKSINGGKFMLKMWDDAYNEAVSSGIREHSAKSKATRMVRLAAHKS